MRPIISILDFKSAISMLESFPSEDQLMASKINYNTLLIAINEVSILKMLKSQPDNPHLSIYPAKWEDLTKLLRNIILLAKAGLEGESNYRRCIRKLLSLLKAANYNELIKSSFLFLYPICYHYPYPSLLDLRSSKKSCWQRLVNRRKK